MNRTKYPMNEVELESEDSDDDDSESELDDVYVFLTSSGNQDDTEEDFDDDDGSVDGADDADDGSALDPFLENMLNIELDADAGGFEFANDIFDCLLFVKIDRLLNC
jgi:hypothetical protein